MASRLELLFNLYATDLRRFAPSLEDHFGCPLCTRVIPRSSPLRDIVAEEHVIPEKLGGRLVTLTCRKCNNASGSELESHLVRRVQVDSRKSPMAMRMETGETAQRGEVIWPEDPNETIDLRVVDKQTDSRQTAKFEEMVSEGLGEIKLHMNAGYVELKTRVALVRAAYLLMFRTFGYRYALDPSSQVIRNQIDTPLMETNVLRGVRWKAETNLPSETAIWVMTSPEEFRSFLVMLKLDDDPEHIAGVTIPPPGSNGDEFFNALAKSPPPQITISAQVETNHRGFLPLAELWHHVEAGEV